MSDARFLCTGHFDIDKQRYFGMERIKNILGVMDLEAAFVVNHLLSSTVDQIA